MFSLFKTKYVKGRDFVATDCFVNSSEKENKQIY